MNTYTKFKVGDKLKLIDNKGLGPTTKIGSTVIVTKTETYSNNFSYNMIEVTWLEETVSQKPGGYDINRFELIPEKKKEKISRFAQIAKELTE